MKHTIECDCGNEIQIMGNAAKLMIKYDSYIVMCDECGQPWGLSVEAHKVDTHEEEE